MKHRRRISNGWAVIVLAMVAGGVVFTSAAAPGQDATAIRRVRAVMWYPDVTIADRLLPDDEVVELDSPFREHLLNQVVLTRAETTEFLTSRSALVAVADVTGVAGELDVDRTRPQTAWWGSCATCCSTRRSTPPATLVHSD